MSKLHAFIKSLDDAEESLRPFYVENEELGGFILQVESHESDEFNLELSDTRGLHTALKKERDAKKEGQAWVKQFGEVGIDKVRELVGLLDSEGNVPDPGKGNDAKVTKLTQQVESLQQEIQERDSKLEGMESKFNAQRAREALDRAILAENSGNNVVLLSTVLKDSVAMVNGKPVIVDENGEPELSTMPGRSGQPMQVDEKLAIMRKDQTYQALFGSTTRSGGGSKGDAGAGGEGGQEPISDPAENPFLEGGTTTARMKLLNDDQKRGVELAKEAGFDLSVYGITP